MKRSIALVSVLGLFLLGIVVGALAMHLYYASRFPPRPPHRGAGMRPGPHPGRFMERMTQELELSPEQERQVEEILTESRAEAEAMRLEMGPRIREHMRRTRERIAELLTPEQREEFEELSRRNGRRADRFFLGR